MKEQKVDVFGVAEIANWICQHLLRYHTIYNYLLMECLATLFVCELLQTVVDHSGTETETNEADWSLPLQLPEEKHTH